MRGFAMFGAVALIAGSALAQTDADKAELTGEDMVLANGGDLFELCSAGAGDAKALQALSFCYGFIEGIYVMHEAMAVAEDGVRLICPPDGATRETAATAFVTWGSQNPEAMTQWPLDALFQAWAEAYPCPDSQ